ncbi:Gfo/Idh/MocA family oxidoreductase [Pikeienuella sp. HZG-20]|uniref:Gfo/Idh/MocA family protein n=1 Tax=Paludibacillus litoralis TaxID=3133267 RepID=UPI0030ED6A0C
MSLRVVCLGAGYFSRFHIDGWRRIGRADLIGVADCDMDKARATGAPAFDRLEAMLDLDPDIVDIILPPEAHAASIRTALAARPRAIICQKPFCVSLTEAREMAALADAAGIPLIVHENFRFQPWYRAIRAAIDEGRIGAPLRATFRLRPGDGQGPNAYLDRQPYFQRMRRFLIHETGVHWIDTFRYLFGDPTHVYADLRRVNPALAGEDAGLVVYDHPNGVRALFDADRSLDHAADNLRRTMGEGLFEGTGGSLTLTGDGVVTLRSFGERQATTLLPSAAHDGFGGDCVRALQSHVVAGLLDGGAFENEARAYLRVIEIEQATYRAASEGRKLKL